MKKLLLIFVTVAFTVVMGAMFLSAAPAAPEKVTVKEFQKKKPAVTFSHKLHADKFGCKECHHKWKGGDATPQKCSECHKAKKEGKKPAAKKAFHKQCKGCHKKMKKAGKKTGPTSCKKCHKG
jgi:hypothetical protein